MAADRSRGLLHDCPLALLIHRMVEGERQMRFRHYWLFLLLVCLPAAGAGAQVVIGQAHGIHSAVLNEERNYQVYLPDSYAWAKERRYSVLYVLDGGNAHAKGDQGGVGMRK